MTRLRSWAGNLALILFGIAAPLVLAESALRALDRARPGGKEQVERNSYTEYDPVLGWRKTTGANVSYVRRDYRSSFRINAHGLRGPERSLPKPAGTLRVLALGDSFVEAFMVSDEEMVTTQIEWRLRARLGCPVEVLNGGTVGYSTDQEYLFYRDVGHRFGADIVILFTYHNDLPPLVRDRYHAFPKPILSFEEAPPKVANEPVPVYRAESAPPTAPAAPAGLHLLEFVKDRIERGSARTYNRLASWGVWEPLRVLPANEEINLYRSPPMGHLNPVWSAYTWTLDSLKRLTASHQSGLVVAYIPSRMEVNDPDYEITEARYGVTPSTFDRSAVSDRINSITGRFDIPFIDLTPALKRATGTFRPVYFATDSHWNARGQAAAGVAAADFLVDQRGLTCLR